MPEFRKRHHRIIASVLRSLNARLLADARCFFGGGTQLAMAYGEYRESRDVDFLCSDRAGFRSLREQVTQVSLGKIVSGTLKLAREVRSDRDGIRTFFDGDGARIKFEILLEARIDLDGQLSSLFRVPTLGRALAEAGFRLAVVSAASQGTTTIVGWRADLVVGDGFVDPPQMQKAVDSQFGRSPGRTSPDTSRLNEHMTRVATDYVLPEYRPDVLLLWLGEPDAAQHKFGLSSAQAREAIKQNDRLLGQLRRRLPERATVIVVSDHGHSHVISTGDAALAKLGERTGWRHGQDYTLASDGIYVHMHDILLPYDYLPEWAGRYYSEQYMLASYLLGGGRGTEVILPCTFAWLHPKLASALAPLCEGSVLGTVALHGASFWMRTTGDWREG
jgi:hypothetical protein